MINIVAGQAYAGQASYYAPVGGIDLPSAGWSGTCVLVQAVEGFPVVATGTAAVTVSTDHRSLSVTYSFTRVQTAALLERFYYLSVLATSGAVDIPIVHEIVGLGNV